VAIATRRKKAAHPHVSALSPSEKGAVLDELLSRNPALLEAAEEAARRLLATVDPGAVADDVESALMSHSHEEIGDRAGYHPGEGYVEPTQAAWDILGEAFEVFVTDIERLVALGHKEAARATALGVLGGLRRCEDGPSEDTVLSWAEDFPGEAAGQVMRLLKDADIAVTAGEVEAVAPGWGDSFGE
jgi:hypothetical protein